MVLISQASRGGEFPPLRGHDGHLLSTLCCWRCSRPLYQQPVGLPTAFFCSEFVTVGDADKPWHPQLFTAIVITLPAELLETGGSFPLPALISAGVPLDKLGHWNCCTSSRSGVHWTSSRRARRTGVGDGCHSSRHGVHGSSSRGLRNTGYQLHQRFTLHQRVCQQHQLLYISRRRVRTTGPCLKWRRCALSGTRQSTSSHCSQVCPSHWHFRPDDPRLHSRRLQEARRVPYLHRKNIVLFNDHLGLSRSAIFPFVLPRCGEFARNLSVPVTSTGTDISTHGCTGQGFVLQANVVEECVSLNPLCHVKDAFLRDISLNYSVVSRNSTWQFNARFCSLS